MNLRLEIWARLSPRHPHQASQSSNRGGLLFFGCGLDVNLLAVRLSPARPLACAACFDPGNVGLDCDGHPWRCWLWIGRSSSRADGSGRWVNPPRLTALRETLSTPPPPC